MDGGHFFWQSQMSPGTRDAEWEGAWWLITGPAGQDKEQALDSKARVLKHMKLKNWVVAYETGESGYQHYHIVIQTYKKVKAKTVRKWFPQMDVTGSVPGTQDNPWNYSLKDGDFIMKEKNQGARKDLDEMKQALDDGYDLDYLWQNYFSKMVIYHRSMKEYLRISRKRKHEFDEDVDPDRFCIPFDDLSLPLVVAGPSDIGKTAWAECHFKNPMMISDIEDLKDFNFDPNVNDGIVFDDMDFTHWPRTAQIHLLDIKRSRTIHMRFMNWERPKGVKMIFTTNNHPFMDDPAINRRMKRIWVDKVYN